MMILIVSFIEQSLCNPTSYEKMCTNLGKKIFPQSMHRKMGCRKKQCGTFQFLPVIMS
jgi:hypothetical protein